jgi:hypothetical protein
MIYLGLHQCYIVIQILLQSKDQLLTELIEVHHREAWNEWADTIHIISLMGARLLFYMCVGTTCTFLLIVSTQLHY